MSLQRRQMNSVSTAVVKTSASLQPRNLLSSVHQRILFISIETNGLIKQKLPECEPKTDV